jgi:hypothetical protein
MYITLLTIAGKGYNTYVEGDFHSTLHADAAGYNVYLPSIYPYDFKGKFAYKQDEECGGGFWLEDSTQKVITKYNYGVALLQSPFYAAGLGYAKLTNKEFTGYNPFCQRLVDCAGVFYGVCGLILLFFFLRNYFSAGISFFSVLILFACFNIFWYILVQPGMSHVYSFFLFTLFLFLAKKYTDKKHWLTFVVLCFTGALILLIRPLNGIFMAVLFFLPSAEHKTIKDRLLVFFSVKNMLIALLILVAVFTPQVIYWKFAWGSYFPDTYPNEKFLYLSRPKLRAFLFAAKSGLMVWTPVYFLLLPLLGVLAIRSKEMYYKAALAILLVLMYLTASWYEYFFGCGLGNRNFAEYCVLFAFPVGAMLQWLLSRRVLLAAAGLIIAVCAAVNIKLTESFDMCFFGENIWDFKEFSYLVFNRPHHTKIDYESASDYVSKSTITADPWNPDNKCSKVGSKDEFASTLRLPVSDLGMEIPRKVEFAVDIKPVGGNYTSEIVLHVLRNDSQIFYQSLPYHTIDPVFRTFHFYSPLPKDLQKTDTIEVFFWNKGYHEFYTDNYDLKFR